MIHSSTPCGAETSETGRLIDRCYAADWFDLKLSLGGIYQQWVWLYQCAVYSDFAVGKFWIHHSKSNPTHILKLVEGCRIFLVNETQNFLLTNDSVDHGVNGCVWGLHLPLIIMVDSKCKFGTIAKHPHHISICVIFLKSNGIFEGFFDPVHIFMHTKTSSEK